MIEFTFSDIFSRLIISAQWTLALSAVAFIGGALLAIVLVLGKRSSIPSIRHVSNVWIKLVQGLPLLILLFLGFFGLPLIGIHVTAWIAASVILTIYTSAFLADIWNSSINAISKNQWSAAASLGMRPIQQFILIILPQAARITIPATVGFLVQVIKNTSLTSIIGFVELSRTASILNNITFNPFPIYASVAVIYFCICFPLTLTSRILEKKLKIQTHA